MKRLGYCKIDKDLEFYKAQLLNAFPANENYINNILSRSSIDSIKESLAALMLLSQILQKECIETRDLVLKKNINGKPYFENSNVKFSLSHTKNHAAAVISDKNIGLDIEEREFEDEKYKNISKRFFTAEETKFISDKESFLKIWTFKEAYAKCKDLSLTCAFKTANYFDESINREYTKYENTLICQIWD